MAVPYILDAETGVSEFDFLRQDSSNTVTQSATRKNSGSNSFKMFFGDPADRDCYGRKDTDETGLTEAYCRFYINLVDYSGTVGSGHEIMNIWRDGAGNYLSQLYIYPISGGGFGLRHVWFVTGSNGNTYNNQSTADIDASDTWHAIEIRLKKAATGSSNDGISTIWLDDVELGTVTNLNNFDLMSTGVNQFVFGGENGTAPDINTISWYDDIEINTSKIGLKSSALLEQEGFRWRNDDDDEVNASWRQDQDTDDSITKNTNLRLRVLLNATGDPSTKQYQLEYKETDDNDTEYRKVPL